MGPPGHVTYTKMIVFSVSGTLEIPKDWCIMNERRIVVEMATEKLDFREISKMIVFQVHKRGYFSSPRLRKVQWSLCSKGTMKNIILDGRKVLIWRFAENPTFQSPFPRQFFSRSLYTNHLGFRGGQTPKN